MADLPVPLYHVHAAVLHHKIYVTGRSSVEGAKHQVYVYNVDNDQWGQLPPPGHYYSIPHIIGDKLAIIGGHLSATEERTNKVSTFDYPDLLSVRSRPGVVSHLEHVIVAGGKLNRNTMLDDIEVLNWMENSHWRRVPTKLPVPMYDFTPTISDYHMLMVGYYGADRKPQKGAYKLPVASITTSIDQQHSETSSRWIDLTPATHTFTVLVLSSSPPVIVGGWLHGNKTSTADIKMHDNSDHSWKKIGSLSSPKCMVAVAAVQSLLSEDLLKETVRLIINHPV